MDKKVTFSLNEAPAVYAAVVQRLTVARELRDRHRANPYKSGGARGFETMYALEVSRLERAANKLEAVL